MRLYLYALTILAGVWYEARLSAQPGHPLQQVATCSVVIQPLHDAPMSGLVCFSCPTYNDASLSPASLAASNASYAPDIAAHNLNYGVQRG